MSTFISGWPLSYLDFEAACRAVIAAKLQGQEQAMVDAIQRGYYLRAMNPSNIAVLITLSEELADNDNRFDTTEFKQDLNSAKVEQEFKRQRELAQQISVQGYPSLVLKYQNVFYPIMCDYLTASVALNEIKRILNQTN
jgi:putative protein-disulfide isomerase